MSQAQAAAGIDSIPAAASLAEVLPALMPDLLRYLARRLDDREDAADALAETLLVLWRKERRLPSDAEGVRRYAFGVAAKVLSRVRRGRLRRTALADRLRDGVAGADAGGDPADLVDPPLGDALAALPERDRELLLLVAWDGFGVAEAGAVLGLKPAAARQRYSRARARLRAALAASS